MYQIRILPTTTPPGKLADVEVHFTSDGGHVSDTDTALHGLKLIGFAIWERRGGHGRNVTFPARQYSVNGERRAFALLRPAGTWDSHGDPMETLRDRILDAFAQFEAREAASQTDATRPGF